MPPTQGNAPQVSWKVVSQQETVQASPQGGVTRGVTVTFTLANGTSGTVFVPDAMFNPNNVRAAIAAKAGLMAEVGNLTN